LYEQKHKGIDDCKRVLVTKMQKLFLHAGPPKTGSTLIQSQLFAHKKKLREAKIVYIPNRELREEQRRKFRSYVSDGMGQLSADFAKFLVGEMTRRHVRPDDTVILSWEEVLGPPLEPPRGYVFPYAREVLESIEQAARSLELELHFIFYIRRQDEFLESWATQRVQAGHALSYEDFTKRFVSPRKVSWRRILQAATTILGVERTHVHLFEDIKRGPQFFLDQFLSTINPTVRIPYDQTIFSNQSFSALAYQVALEAFKYMPSMEKRRKFVKFLQLNCGGERYGKCKFLNSEQRDDLIAHYENENRAIFATHGLDREIFDSHYSRKSSNGA